MPDLPPLPRVLVLIANEAVDDPRVARQVAALDSAGHDVDVIGVSDNATPPVTMPGARSLRHVSGLKATYQEISAIALTAVALCLLGLIAIAIRFPDLFDRTWLVGGVVFVGVICLATVRHLAMRRAQGKRTADPAPGAWRLKIAEQLNRFAAWRLTQRFVSEAGSADYDVVHAHEPDTLFAGKRIATRQQARLIYDAHEYYAGQQGASEQTVRQYMHTLDSCAEDIDLLVTVSNSMGEATRQLHPALPEYALVTNSGARFPTASYDNRLHDACNARPGDRICLFQGGLSRGRGLEKLVEAAQQLAGHWRVAVIGSGAIAADLQAADVSGRVYFLGRKPPDELWRWTQGADLGFVGYEASCENHRVSLPNKIWEYAVCEVPSLVGDLPEARDYVLKHECGFVLPPKYTSADLVEQIGALNTTRLASAVEGARRIAAAERAGAYQNMLLSAYASAAAAPAKRSR